MLVMGAGPADVETVVVAGEILRADGALVGPHVERARELMRESRSRLGSPVPVSV
jgi:5-methylthioadenosine/S-adenosylhomocysteine deaminase